jgi:hypothetical protein
VARAGGGQREPREGASVHLRGQSGFGRHSRSLGEQVRKFIRGDAAAAASRRLGSAGEVMPVLRRRWIWGRRRHLFFLPAGEWVHHCQTYLA